MRSFYSVTSARRSLPVLRALTVSLFVVGPLASATAAQANSDFTVVSFNLNAFVSDTNASVQSLAEIDADIILLQESSPKWERVLRAKLKGSHPYAFFHHPKRRAGSIGVLSRLPLSEKRVLPKAGGGVYPALYLEIQTSAGPLRFLNVHLYPPVLLRRVGWIRAYTSSLAIHKKELAAHLDGAPSVPDIIAGDFNEAPGAGGLADLRRRGFEPALPADRPTWHWRRLGELVELQLDNLYVATRLKTSKSKVVKAGTSDHWPVVTTISRSVGGQ